MKSYKLIILILLVSLLCCKKESNDTDDEWIDWTPKDTYLIATINGENISVGYNDSFSIGRSVYFDGPNDSIFLQKWHDYFIDGADEILTIIFIKKVNINDVDTSGDIYLYNDFSNYIDTADLCFFTTNTMQNHSNLIWIQYKRQGKYFKHSYCDDLDTSKFSFKIDSLKYFEVTDNRNQTWLNFLINGRFKCQLVDYDNYNDTITITEATFKSWIKSEQSNNVP